MKKVLFSIMCAVSMFAAVRASAATNIILHGEIGSYNTGYKDWEYDEIKTIPSLMTNLGAEFKYTGPKGHILGTGIVQTTISEGNVSKIYIENEEGKLLPYEDYLLQPSTLITVPYFFIGKDFTLWSLELGVSYYVSVQKYKAREYRSINTNGEPDGTTKTAEPAGFGLDRPGSHVYVNMMARILPEDWLHFKLRFGRERFNAIDSFCNVAVFYPYKNHLIEAGISFPIGSYLENNQRASLGYTYSMGAFKIGASAGYLTAGERSGGTGEFLNNLSGGFHVGLAW